MDERLKKIINHPVMIPAIVGVTSFVVGVGSGWILGRRSMNIELEAADRKLEAMVREMFDADKTEDPDQLVLDLEEQIEEVVTGLRNLAQSMGDDEPEPDLSQWEQVRPEPLTNEVDPELEALLEEEIQIEEAFQQSLASAEQTDEQEHPSVVRQSVFAETGDDWDYTVELAHRAENPKKPYVIHKDEFFSGESDYSQNSLCYYAGDDILTDEEDKPIFSYASVTGDLDFGRGSGDANVVYIRNDELRAEYEILRHTGLYATEILGIEYDEVELENELKHSVHRRFRQE
jgi:hypothetical protein